MLDNCAWCLIAAHLYFNIELLQAMRPKLQNQAPKKQQQQKDDFSPVYAEPI